MNAWARVLSVSAGRARRRPAQAPVSWGSVVAVVAAVGLAASFAGAAAATDEKARPHNDPKNTYTVMRVEGWTVRVSARYDGAEALRDRVLDEVRAQLRRITMLVNPEPLAELRKVEIWVERDYPKRCQYHDDATWLRENGYLPEKASTVEIAKGEEFLNWQARPVLTLLHELAHAYHDRVLGWNDPRIVKAFEDYRKSGKGDKVVRDHGRVCRHYALSNHKEYFAEMTEAYLWVNDYYPFVYGELKDVDPGGAKLLEAIWGKRR